jgi:anti-anti-sigma factor
VNIEINQGEQVTVVQITGSVDSLTADALMQAFSNEVGADRIRLVADFSGVEYTSSAGLRALLTTLKDARGQGGDLRLAAVRPTVRKVLDLTGFTSILKIFDDVPTAVASFVVAGGGAGAGA